MPNSAVRIVIILENMIISPQFFKIYIGYLLDSVSILLIPYNVLMIWRQNSFVNWFPLENHPENSGHPVRYYSNNQCPGSSYMVIGCLVLQSPQYGIGCQQILEMLRHLTILNLS